MILHNGTGILITIRFQKFGSSYIEYIPNDEQKAIEKGESLRFTLNDLVFGKYVGYTSDKTTPFYDCYIKRRGTLYTTLKNVEEEMAIMCNLGQGIEDEGMKKGEAKIIFCMYKNGLSVEKIAEITDKNVENIQNIITESAVE